MKQSREITVRIVGGRFKGLRLTVPPGRNIRPTTDRAREALFNILSHSLSLDFRSITVLDLFAGTGALGFEALSRGAERVLFVDNEHSAIECIKSNGKHIGQTHFFSVRDGDASCLPPRTSQDKPATLAFLDPPYRKRLVAPTLLAIDKGNWMMGGAVIVVEIGRNEKFEIAPSFSLSSERLYGNSKITFLSN